MRDRAYRRKERERHIKRKEYILRKWQRDNKPHIFNDKNTIWYYSDIPLIAKTRDGKWFHIPNGIGDCLPFHLVKARGMLNKNKIHCSCGMCSTKTRNKSPKRRTVHANYAPNINYKYSDLKKIECMEQKEKELIF